MGISAVTVTLSGAPAEQRKTERALARHPYVTLGPRRGPRVAMVLDAPSLDEERATFAWLQGQPGVTQVALVLCSVGEPTAEPERPQAG
jgi:hypothetical protein